MNQRTGKILIADDEPTLLKMLSAYLARLGYSVTTANTGDQAWSEVEAAPGEFAAVVLDASMPGIGIIPLTLKMLAAHPGMCVLAASGYPVDISDVAATAPGRVDFLQKPFTGEKLAAALRRMIAAQEEGV